jgi:chromosome segregation ATPase
MEKKENELVELSFDKVGSPNKDYSDNNLLSKIAELHEQIRSLQHNLALTRGEVHELKDLVRPLLVTIQELSKVLQRREAIRSNYGSGY